MPLRCARSQRESSERHSPLYVSNTAREMSGMTIDESGTSFPPMYESVIAVRALTAAGLSKSSVFTVVQSLVSQRTLFQVLL